MSLENMKARLEFRGGAAQQDRMIKDKLRSMLSAIKYSYQAARFTLYPALDTEYQGLFNRIVQNENFDTKMISTHWDNGFKVGDIFKWENTDTFWIIFLQERTELAYFRGECRRCDYKVEWVDADKNVQEALMSVIGPTVPTLRTSSSMQAKVAGDFPNQNLKILVTDNELNRGFFHRYQRFLLQGTAYRIEEVDRLSMPGVIQLNATEHYANPIEDDVEENLRNAWNVMPIMEEHPTDYAIDGPAVIKPKYEAYYEAIIAGGEWIIVENQNVPDSKRIPAGFVELDRHQKQVHVIWNSLKSGNFTLGYLLPDGTLYQKNVHVESLM